MQGQFDIVVCRTSLQVACHDKLYSVGGGKNGCQDRLAYRILRLFSATEFFFSKL